MLRRIGAVDVDGVWRISLETPAKTLESAERIMNRIAARPPFWAQSIANEIKY
jgi:hypothetical protein